MALATTGLAIGSVSRFLSGALTNALWNVPPYNPKITVQRPQADIATTTATQPRINLFLYEMDVDGAMRNISLTPGSPAPLWVVLRYLVTAFDGMGESDTPDSHDLLGMAMQVLAGAAADLPALTGYPALADNPEPLKLSFDACTPELLSRLMQGPDDKYRCSAAFQVRPVLIAQPQPLTGMQLIGINYLLGTTIGRAGVKNFVLPSLGPQLDGARPAAVESGDSLTLLGEGLAAPALTVKFGSAVLTPGMQTAQTLSVRIVDLDPASISAGMLSVSVSQTLAKGTATGLAISSGVVGVALLPTVTGVVVGALSAVSATDSNVHGTLLLSGEFLGRADDYVEFALVREGAVALLIDAPDPAFAAPADQSQQQFVIPPSVGVPPGVYFAVYRVNGQQARQAWTLALE